MCHYIRHFPTSQTTHDLWMSVNKYYGTDYHSEIWPLPLDRLGSLGCCNFMICTYHGVLGTVHFQTLTGKPVCYSISFSTQQINNWPFFLLTCIPQEALPFGVRSWLFSSSHFFLIVIWFLVKICDSDWKITLSSSELNLLQETFKMIVSNMLSRHFSSLEFIIHQASFIIYLLSPRD